MKILTDRLKPAGVIPQALFPAGRGHDEIEPDALDVRRGGLVFFLLIKPIRATARFGEGDFVRLDLSLNMAAELPEDAGLSCVRILSGRHQGGAETEREQHRDEERGSEEHRNLQGESDNAGAFSIP